MRVAVSLSVRLS